MNSDQINSALRTLLKIAGGALLANGGVSLFHTGVTMSPELWEAISGLVLAGVGSWLSHQNHVEDAPTPPTAPQP